MPQVRFQPMGKIIDLPAGTGLLDAARQAGVDIDAPCGGEGVCGKCIVRILSGEVEFDSHGTLPPASVAGGYVLACKTTLLAGDISVAIPEKEGRSGGQFSESLEEHGLIRKELLPVKWEFDPRAVKWMLEVPPPRLEDGLSDFDRFKRTIQNDWGRKPVTCSLRVLQALATALREDDGRVTASLVCEQDVIHVVRVEPGDGTTRQYGIAVDIGTTTVAVQLVFLEMGRIISTQFDYNDQVACGLDVISRMNYARREGGLDELRERVLGTINGLIKKAADHHGIAPREICNAVISANTTMVHLLLGLNPENIRLEPYTPTVLQSVELLASEVGIDINPDSRISISPGVGSYVGGDITAGVLCTDLATDSEDVNLFIDIGTNGEIVIGNCDFLMTCACSAGPAFEGGGIACGMRAAIGAIERVHVDPESGLCEVKTIGDTKPVGVCGSGMIALIADLFLTGWINPAGKLNRERASSSIEVEGRSAYFVLVPTEASGTGEALRISETDIENILRTKAAIYSACALMLDQVEMSFDDLSHIYIAGGFGRFLDLDKATVLGLIPDQPREKFKYLGNASLMGSYMTLVSREYHQKQLELANRMTYVELSTDPAYMDQYTAALFLPHTDITLFPSVKRIADC